VVESRPGGRWPDRPRSRSAPRRRRIECDEVAAAQLAIDRKIELTPLQLQADLTCPRRTGGFTTVGWPCSTLVCPAPRLKEHPCRSRSVCVLERLSSVTNLLVLSASEHALAGLVVMAGRAWLPSPEPDPMPPCAFVLGSRCGISVWRRVRWLVAHLNLDEAKE
jgi:hypothetical protein